MTENDDADRIVPKSPKEAIEPEVAPPPPMRKREGHPFFAIINGALSFLVFCVIGLGATLYLGKLRYDSPGPLETARTVIIERGDGTATIAEKLERAGVVDEPIVFRLGVMLTKSERDLKAGEYLFEAGVSVGDVIATLVDGKSILHQVTMPEGLTSLQIVERLNEEPMLAGEIREIPKEGTLLPETYKFTRGTDRQEILNRMSAAHERLLAEVWERRVSELPIETPEEMVILASIVEKETGRADERNRVAGVFINRLNRGMRLQSDPTIIYGIVGGQGSLGRGIRRSEIDALTPYNTYQIDGLPPTPIANPGRASLEAVANPSRTDDLFFVADGTGGHAFAETYDEHNRNVARWREIEAERAAEAEAEAAAEGESASEDSTN